MSKIALISWQRTLMNAVCFCAAVIRSTEFPRKRHHDEMTGTFLLLLFVACILVHSCDAFKTTRTVFALRIDSRSKASIQPKHCHSDSRTAGLDCCPVVSALPSFLDNATLEACRLLGRYDEIGEAAFPPLPQHQPPNVPMTLADARHVVDNLKSVLTARGEISEMFGIERNGVALEAPFSAIYQTFGGDDLYPMVEQKAANLIYFVIKDHPFTDGNKRIGLVLFKEFLRMAGKPLSISSPAALARFAISISKSDPADKDIVVDCIVDRLTCLW